MKNTFESGNCTLYIQVASLAQLLPPRSFAYVHVQSESCCSPLASASAAGPRLRPIASASKINCCSPTASASTTAAPQLRPLVALAVLEDSSPYARSSQSSRYSKLKYEGRAPSHFRHTHTRTDTSVSVRVCVWLRLNLYNSHKSALGSMTILYQCSTKVAYNGMHTITIANYNCRQYIAIASYSSIRGSIAC